MARPGDATLIRIDVYNYYADSPHADHHQVATEDIDWVCANDLHVLSTGHRVGTDDMTNVPVTVFQLMWSGTDAPGDPIHVYWLKHNKGVAVGALGRTYVVPNSTLQPYYAADAERIPRALVPGS